jgi:hypothetical protein
MSKISTYEVAPVPKLADKLIGTSVGGEIEDVTYNFTLQELLDVFLPVIPANNLQGVLDYGNTATQDINLIGTITTTNLEVTDTANFLNSYFVGDTHIQGGLFDSEDSIGLAGQVLTSTGEFVEWVTLPPIFTPNLQQVLEEGNTSTTGIILDAGLEALDVDTDTATINTNITIDGTITDGDASVGAAGTVLSSTVTGVKWVALPVYSATSPLLFNSATGVFSIQQANGSQSGFLSSSDWVTFNGKQNAGNYITALTGEVTASGPGSATATVSNAAVIGKVLTGFNPTAGTINASDSILTAFGKTQSQINALVGGVQYQGVWNASTNTPTLTSSVGVQGHYYVVNVAGNTNLNGITDWQVGDWAIFSESVWQKVDNTESVSSVNGFTGAVSLTTDNIPEGTTNLYFLNSRARLALSATSPLGYDNVTGVFSIQVANSSQNGYLSSTDWTTFNGKQNYLGGTGLVKSTAGTITYITDNSGNWDTAYNDSIISAAVTGTGTKTLTLTQQDAGTITASWTDLGLTSVGVSMPSAFNVANSPLTANGTIAITGAGNASQYVRGDGTLAVLPTGGGGGGASVSYYLNGSINQGTIGGVTYYEMNKVPVIGAGTDFSRSTNGYIASFLTDVNDPALLQIPAGNWNFETYFNASSGGGSPTFYIELYKYDGVVFTLIASNSASPKLINDGTSIEAYFNALAVPQTALTLTDRLAVRIYVTTAGRTITLHTENSHLCQVITTFTTGITAINGLTAQVQNLTTGTSGTDFNINSLVDTHTFNLPVASAANTGKLSSTDWSTFNAKQNALTLTTTGTSGAATLVGATLNIPQYTDQFVGTVTSVAALTLGTTGTDLSSTVVNSTTTPVITLNVPTASAANRGALSAADWSTFNTKVGSVTASSPLASSGGSTPNITIQQSSGSQDGYLSSTDWTTFNNKQAAGNYITSLTGEATATGPGAAAVTLNNASVTGKVLTGVNITGGTVQATDTMLTAFGKLQNQINGLIGSTIYQGTWNASTNTPALASGVGVRGYYYIVSVAGTTNLDGITDWFVGDWAIFDGTAWQQVDNTDAVVSVNGQTGAVSLTTDNIPEGVTNQYYLDSRARAALSFTAGSGAYNSTTGVITIPTNTSQLTNGASFITLASLSGTAPIQYNNTTGAISITQSGTASNGFLSSTDWNTFNNKQAGSTNLTSLAALTFASTSFVKMTASGTFALDTNTYALASALGNYLPLAGGTLTGALVGTTANFSVNVNNSNSGLDLTNSGTLGYGNSINFYQSATKAVQIFAESSAPNTSEIEFRTIVGGTLAKRFKIEANGAATFTSSITASSLIKSGGTSLQFLKADGSVDSNTYVTLDTTQTISGTKTFSSVIGATASAVFNATGRGTDYQYADMTNTSGRMIIGVDSSVGGSIIPSNSQPYSVSFGTDKNRFLHLFTNDLPRLNITGGGNVLIGTLTDGGYKLDVSAKGRFFSSVGAEVLRVEGPNTTDNFISVYSGGIHIFLDADNSNSAGIVGTQSNHPLIFRTNGANKARFSVDGNLLLNTTTDAGYKLDINGTGRFTSNLTIGSGSLLILGNSNDANSMQIWNSQSGASNNLLIYDNAASAYRFVIGSNGNTAIGTSSPNDKLTIARNAADNSGGVTLYNENTSGYGSALTFRVNYAGVYNTSRIHGDWDTGNSGALHFFTANTSQSLVERMTINGVGNVFINTGGISGGGALQVNGNVNINGVFQINGTTIGGGGGSGVTGSGTSGYHSKWTGGTSLGNGVLYDDGTRIGLNTTSAVTATRFQIDYSGSSNYGIFINQTTSNEATMRFKSTHDANSDYRIGASILISSAFEIYSTNAASTRFAVASNGNILINTTTDAGYKLDVNGTVRSTGGFFDTSDSRLKIIVKDYKQPKGIENVVARMYVKNGKQELGYYAQDLQKILPSAVIEGNDGFLGLSYSQVHTAKISVIESEIDILKNKVSELEFKLQKYEA